MICLFVTSKPFNMEYNHRWRLKGWRMWNSRIVIKCFVAFELLKEFSIMGILSWQLRLDLWCHSTELSIGFVHRISHFVIYMKFEIRNQHNSFRNANRLDAAISYSKVNCSLRISPSFYTHTNIQIIQMRRKKNAVWI